MIYFRCTRRMIIRDKKNVKCLPTFIRQIVTKNNHKVNIKDLERKIRFYKGKSDYQKMMNRMTELCLSS